MMKPSSSENISQGYLNANYAAALAEFGQPYFLKESGGWILKRSIQNTDYTDAIGCYPLFSCQNWRALIDDFSSLEEKLVSIAVVTDPFGNYDELLLQQSFQDIIIPFKEHYVVDLTQPLENLVSSHHRYYSRKSNRVCRIERSINPETLHVKWVDLYNQLIRRHHIDGIKAFSPKSLKQQLSIPGVEAFIGCLENEVIGIQLWLGTGRIAYHHLSAYSETGYRSRISYGLMWEALKYFQDKRFLWGNLGAGAGINKKEDGLTKFKIGWASGTKTAYFCGKIFRRSQYNELVRKTGTQNVSFFPAYRNGKF